ncbi:hypothetical protein PTKIN_Ptkin10aG0188700 [Pterospermum kingtungense]
MENSMVNMVITGEEDEELILEVVEEQQLDVNPDLCLVGRFLTDKPIRFHIMKHRMASIWQPRKGINIKEITPHLFAFQFFHMVDLKRVLEGGPWTFDNHLLLLHSLSPGEIPSQVPLVTVEF